MAMVCMSMFTYHSSNVQNTLVEYVHTMCLDTQCDKTRNAIKKP
jgi:hypothetical protein